MLVDYNEMPESSRVWVYQADRMFNESEKEFITELLHTFLADWKRHGEDLKASYQIKYDQFIVLLVDQNHVNVSGCAIDASVNLIKKIEDEFQLDLTNKLNITFKDHENINLVSLAMFKEYVKKEKITENTVVFNNLVETKADFESKWEVVASNSWHRRFLPV